MKEETSFRNMEKSYGPQIFNSSVFLQVFKLIALQMYYV